MTVIPSERPVVSSDFFLRAAFAILIVGSLLAAYVSGI